MKSTRFKAWVEGLQWQFDLYLLETGKEASGAGELTGWTRKHWQSFLLDIGVTRSLRYHAEHPLSERFRIWTETKIIVEKVLHEQTPG